MGTGAAVVASLAILDGYGTLCLDGVCWKHRSSRKSIRHLLFGLGIIADTELRGVDEDPAPTTRVSRLG